MTLAPQLNPPTLWQAALLLMTTAATWSDRPPAARGVAVTANGAPSAASVNPGSRGLSAIKVGTPFCFDLDHEGFFGWGGGVEDLFDPGVSFGYFKASHRVESLPGCGENPTLQNSTFLRWNIKCLCG